MTALPKFTDIPTLPTAWGRSHGNGHSSDGRAPFRCVRCGLVRWHYVADAAEGNWPTCPECEDEWDCMELVAGDEAAEMVPPRAGEKEG